MDHGFLNKMKQSIKFTKEFFIRIIILICVVNLAACDSSPRPIQLGSNYLDYYYEAEKHIISSRNQKIVYDEYINFDNYIVIKKKYEGKDIVKIWESENSDKILYDEDGKMHVYTQNPDTVPKLINNVYYYIINKRINELEGPFSYNEFLDKCNEKELYLF